MKSAVSSLLVAIVVATSGFFATVVHAKEYTPLYTFNEGIVEVNKTCSAEEWTLVQDAMALAMDPQLHFGNRKQRRGLRINRKLRCESCGGRPLCLMRVGHGCARLASRRENRALTTDSTARGINPPIIVGSKQEHRSLYNGQECRDDVNAVDIALEQLQPLLSAPCQDLVSAQRRIVTCAELTHECDILGFTFYRNNVAIKRLDLTSTHASSSNSNNTVCTSNSTVALQAESDFFVGDVTFELRGPNGYTHSIVEGSRPYNAFGKTSRMFRIHRRMAPGDYTVHAFSQDAPQLGKTANFTISNCLRGN